MLINRIKSDQLTYRKAGVKHLAASLTTVIGEAEAIGKHSLRAPTDVEVIGVLKKTVAGLEEVAKHLDIETEEYHFNLLERGVLTAFLPEQLTEEELKRLATEFVLEERKPSLGGFFKVLKMNYEGRYDGNLAKSVYNDTFDEAQK